MSRKPIVRILLYVLAGLALLVVGAGVALATIDFRPILESAASKALDRRLTVGSLRIAWGSPVGIEISDLRLANADGASDPDMLRIERLTGELEWRSLFAGHLVFRSLVATRPAILLEHTAGGGGNWRFGDAAPHRTPRSPRRFAVVPRNRAEFPTLLRLIVTEGALTYRGSEGGTVQIGMGRLALDSESETAPVRIALDGAINGVPARLTGDTELFDRLRDPKLPFGTKLALAAAQANLSLDGSMMEPLDFNGVRGQLALRAARIQEFASVFHLDLPVAAPLDIAGRLDKQGDDWRLEEAGGTLGKDRFTGRLSLKEAARGQPDAIFATLDFDTLDPGGLAGSSSGPAGLRADDRPGVVIDARLAARTLHLGGFVLADAGARIRTAPALMALEDARFGLLGARVTGEASARLEGGRNRMAATLDIVGADVAELARSAGAGPGQISGRMDGRAKLEMVGDSLTQALGAASGFAVVSMGEGRIARSLVEKLSTDVLSVFRHNDGNVAISCLLGVLDLRQGKGVVAPLRMRTGLATMIGAGRIDLARRRVDLTVKSEADSSGFFALDIPLHITGTFDRLGVTPDVGGSTAALEDAARKNPISDLPPRLHELAARGACAG